MPSWQGLPQSASKGGRVTLRVVPEASMEMDVSRTRWLFTKICVFSRKLKCLLRLSGDVKEGRPVRLSFSLPRIVMR